MRSHPALVILEVEDRGEFRLGLPVQRRLNFCPDLKCLGFTGCLMTRQFGWNLPMVPGGQGWRRGGHCLLLGALEPSQQVTWRITQRPRNQRPPFFLHSSAGLGIGLQFGLEPVKPRPQGWGGHAALLATTFPFQHWKPVKQRPFFQMRPFLSHWHLSPQTGFGRRQLGHLPTSGGLHSCTRSGTHSPSSRWVRGGHCLPGLPHHWPLRSRSRRQPARLRESTLAPGTRVIPLGQD